MRQHKKLRGSSSQFYIHLTKKEILAKMAAEDKMFQWRSCQRKIDYPCYEQAYEKSLELNNEEDARHFQEPYKCEFCEFYHVGRTIRTIVHNQFVAEARKNDIALFYGFSEREVREILKENYISHAKRKNNIVRRIKTAKIKAYVKIMGYTSNHRKSACVSQDQVIE